MTRVHQGKPGYGLKGGGDGGGGGGGGGVCVCVCGGDLSTPLPLRHSY